MEEASAHRRLEEEEEKGSLARSLAATRNEVVRLEELLVRAGQALTKQEGLEPRCAVPTRI